MSKRKSIIFGPLPPPYGGVSVFMSAINSLAEKYDVVVWSYKGKSSNNSNHFRHVNHRRFAHLFTLVREGYKARITDSTHFHLEYPNPILLPLWLIAKTVLRFKWIKLLHDASLPARFEKFGFIQRKLFFLALSQINEIVVSSGELKTWFSDKIRVTKNITFIPPLLPLPQNLTDEQTDNNLKTKLNLFVKHKKRVSSIGIFIPSYGFHHIADAIEKLRDETKEDIGLLLVDGGFEADDKFREDILNRRDWIYVAENVPHPSLSKIFRQSHVFVRATEHESLGLSRIEAIMCGTPVIATNVGETRGMLVYKFNDETALISLLKKVLIENQPVDSKTWAEKFHQEAEENLKKYMCVITGETKE